MLKFIKTKHSKRVGSSRRISDDSVGVYEAKNMYSEILLGLIKYAKNHVDYERVFNREVFRVYCIQIMIDYHSCNKQRFEYNKTTLLQYLAELTAKNTPELLEKQRAIYNDFSISRFFPDQYTDERRIKNDKSEILLGLVKHAQDKYEQAFDDKEFQLTSNITP